MRTAIKTGPGGMEERAVTILTHVRDAERFRVLRAVTAVPKARLTTAQFVEKTDWYGGPTNFAREQLFPDGRLMRTRA